MEENLSETLKNDVYKKELFCIFDNFYLNINGRICLLVSFCWGLIGLIFIKLIVPVFDKTCEKANENKVCIFIAVLLIIYIFDTVLSNIRQLR